MMTRRKKIILTLSGLACLLALYLVIEHVRGRWALAAWENAALARGEKFDIAALAPPLPPEGKNGAINLQAAASRLFGPGVDWFGFYPYAAPGRVIALFPLEDTRGVLQDFRTPTNEITWASVAAELATNAPALARLRSAIQQGSLNFNVQYHHGLAAQLPPLASLRNSARWLSVATLITWHQGRHDEALELLVDAITLARLQQDEPLMLSQLFQNSCTQAVIHAVWQLLQSSGWTDARLARLQAALESLRLPESMMAASVMERAMVRVEFDRCRHHPRHLMNLIAGMGGLFSSSPDSHWLVEVIEPVADPVQSALRNHVYAPIWSFAWADQDELKYLQLIQGTLDRTRVSLSRRSLMEGNFPKDPPEDYDVRHPLSFSVYTKYSETYVVKAFRTETQRQLTLTAIALKRHHLRTGKYPANLQALLPEILAQPTIDPMDGKPLRYRPLENGTFLLYSISENFKDDGGDPTPADSKATPNSINGRDLVWPWPATPEEIAAYRERQVRNLKAK
jgi:hypothetical protein